VSEDGADEALADGKTEEPSQWPVGIVSAAPAEDMPKE
jgi:hypothetical protein